MTTKLDQLKEAYFHWLVNQVGRPGHAGRTYWDVLRVMHGKEFVWIVPNDDNRIVDGMDLRTEFLYETNTRKQFSREEFGPCSVLEIMIGLSRRLAFMANGYPETWALTLLGNLKLKTAMDPLSHRKLRVVHEQLDNLIWRTYDFDGSGGFFPLKQPKEDQTKIEIWAQMSAYLNERRSGY